MFKTVVVGTDGSAHAGRALQIVADMAKADPEVTVQGLTAYRPLSRGQLQDLRAQLPEEFHSLLHAHYGADWILQDARAVFSKAGVSAKFLEQNGDPTDALLDAAEDGGADLIVVGSRGENVAGRAMHGSVSTKLLHHADCTVMVVR